jgi:hypothetical protein
MNAQQMAANEVQNTYPDVYRDEADLKNHAFAIAQQQVQDASGQIEGGTFAVQHFADAYIAAYQHAVEERDAGQ